jgi:hypothetical protein
VAAAQCVQRRQSHPASKRCSAERDGDSSSICMRSTSATRATAGGTARVQRDAPRPGRMRGSRRSGSLPRKPAASCGVRAFGAQQRQVAEGRQAGGCAFGAAALAAKACVVVALERRVQRVRGMPGLHPHLAAAARPASRPARPAACSSSANSRSGGAEIAGEQRAVGVDRSHQRDAAEVVALGDHLRAHQHVHLAGMHGGQLRFQRALGARGVGVDAGHARARGSSAAQSCSSRRSRVPRARSGDVQVAAVGAGARHALGEAAVVAAQRAVAPCGTRARRCSAGTGSSSRRRRSAAPARSRAGSSSSRLCSPRGDAFARWRCSSGGGPRRARLLVGRARGTLRHVEQAAPPAARRRRCALAVARRR